LILPILVIINFSQILLSIKKIYNYVTVSLQSHLKAIQVSVNIVLVFGFFDEKKLTMLILYNNSFGRGFPIPLDFESCYYTMGMLTLLSSR